MPPCPKTHFDLLCDMRRPFVEGMTNCMSKIPTGSYAMSGEELGATVGIPAIVAVYKSDVADHGRQVFSSRGYRGLGDVSDDEVMSMMPPEVVSRHASFFEIEHVVIGNFLHHGRQTYHFSEHLTDRLADTEMNVVADLVTLPFPSAAFVYDCQSARDAAALMSGSPVADGAVVTVYVSMMRIGEEAPSLAMLVVPHEGTHIGSAVSRSLTLKPGSTIEDALKTDWIAENGGSGHEFALPEEHFKTAGLAMARIVVNSALYLASSNPDIVPGIREQLGDLRGTTSKERRKMERALERSTRLDYTAVGRGFRPYDRDGSRSGFKLESRVKVQGHWKMQAHGPGMSLRKIINVEPYWRGPDMAAAVTKPHIVR